MTTQKVSATDCLARKPKIKKPFAASRRSALACLLLLATMMSIAGAQARPVNFQQVGQGQARGGGVLHFDYDWDSSTGKPGKPGRLPGR